jgi:hypothetical protein
MRTLLPLLAAAFLLLPSADLAASPEGGEKIDNPMYTQWSKFKVGAWVRHRDETDMGGMKNSSKRTTKLVEKTAEKLVIEMTMPPPAPGVEIPPQRMEIEAKVDKMEPPPTEPTEPEQKPEVKEGEETIEVAGRKVKCKTWETTLATADMKSRSKTWMSDEVPGGLVKAENVMEKPMAGTSTTVVEDFKTE